MKLEYHLEECSKVTTERLDWHNLENKPYPFDLKKPLQLIQDHRRRKIIPKDYFINKDLEYLKGGDLSKRYSTSVTKTNAATYELKWIEDLVHELWSPVVVKYDPHAYLGTLNWGPTCQSFYGYASRSSRIRRLLQPNMGECQSHIRPPDLLLTVSFHEYKKIDVERRSVKVKELQDKRILKAFKLSYQEKYEHVGPKSQDHKMARLQDDVKAVIFLINRVPESYVSSWFERDMYFGTYHNYVKLVPGMNFWPDQSMYSTVLPPKPRKMLGSQASCSNCKQHGHNKASCKEPVVDLDDVDVVLRGQVRDERASGSRGGASGSKGRGGAGGSRGGASGSRGGASVSRGGAGGSR
ncbi:hypothetical protein Tco_0959425 [Tanacetum coccineum]